MRVVLISLAGIAASLAIFGLSQLADGFLGAVAYMVALLVAPLSIGVAIATAINRRLEVPVGRTARGRGASREASDLHRCGGCGTPKMAMDFAWVCPACDLIPAPR